MSFIRRICDPRWYFFLTFFSVNPGTVDSTNPEGREVCTLHLSCRGWNMPPPNLPQWHKDYFELKVIKKQLLCPPCGNGAEQEASPRPRSGCPPPRKPKGTRVGVLLRETLFVGFSQRVDQAARTGPPSQCRGRAPCSQTDADTPLDKDGRQRGQLCTHFPEQSPAYGRMGFQGHLST